MKSFLFAVGLSVLLSVTACTPVTAVRGNIVEDYRIQELVVNTDGKDDVIRKIGSPTTVAAFDENIWYYVGEKTSKKGILDPKVTEEKILVLTFDKDAKLAQIDLKKDGRTNVTMVEKTTPVPGNEFTFLQQMMGNIGKFNKAGGSSATTTAGGND